MNDELPDLGEQERAIMQLVWAHGPVTAESVREKLSRPLKELTVRTVLRRLEEKGYVGHSVEGRTFLFHPIDARPRVAARAVRRIADWFCNGSIEEILLGLVDAKMLDREQLDALSQKIEAERQRKA